MTALFEKGEHVSVPSGMGGAWSCIVQRVSSSGMVYMTINNKQYPDAHGQEIAKPHYEVKRKTS